MLELMKLLLGIDATDTSKDSILNHYLNKARNIILGYCNVELLDSKYDEIVIDYGVYLYKNKDLEGIESKTEGEKSVNIQIGIPENIKMALPLPKIRVGGY